MSFLTNKFDSLKGKGEKAFIPYLCAGDPDLAFTKDLIHMLSEGSADIIELGIPYSDPLADGPVIQRASQRALKNDFSSDAFLKMINSCSREIKTPLVLMTYYNVIYRQGPEYFVKKIKEAGFEGLVVPDLPVEGETDFREELKRSSIKEIRMAAPAVSNARLNLITSEAEGFIYCVSVKGTTGSKKDPTVEAEKLIKRIKKSTDLPLVVGFGIASPQHVRDISRFADGFIVGTALVNIIEKGIRSKKLFSDILLSVKNFADKLKRASLS